MDDFITSLFLNSMEFGTEKSIVYFLFNENKLVYIGKSIRGQRRISAHTDKKFDSYNFIEVEKEKLDDIEKEMILKYKPKYNDPRDKTTEKMIPLRNIRRNAVDEIGYARVCEYLKYEGIELFGEIDSVFLKSKDIEKAKEILDGLFV